METRLGRFLFPLILFGATLVASWVLDGLVPARAKLFALALFVGLFTFVASKVVDALLRARANSRYPFYGRGILALPTP